MDEQSKDRLILNMINFYTVFQKEILDLVSGSNSSGLSPLLYKMLHEINLDGAIPPSRLSRRLAITIPNTSRSLKKLAELGYITKEKDGTDKRITHLNLTPKGIDLIEASLKATDAILFKKLSVLDLEETNRLSDAFSLARDLLIKMEHWNDKA